jgi:tetratricopeptide (TPR) repeat protein
LNSRIPRDLETIVLKCLRKQPSDRYSTAEALGQDLRRFVRGDPIEARPEAVFEKLTRRISRSKTKVVVSVLFLLLLIAVCILGSAYLATRRKADLALYEDLVRQSLMKILLAETTLRREAQAGQNPHDDLWLFPGDSAVFSPRQGENPLERAASDLREAAKLLPVRPEAPYHRARALFLLNQKEEAREALQHVLDRDPGFVPASVLLKELESTGSTEDEGNETAAASGWATWWLRAYHATREQRWAEAERAFAELMKYENQATSPYVGLSIETRMGRGKARYELEDYSGAVEDFAVARNSWPTFLEPALFLGRAWHRQGDKQRAEKIFQGLLKERPESRDEVACFVALVYKSLMDFEKALEWAEKMPHSFVRERFELDFNFNLHRYDEAIACGKAALELKPDDYFSLCMLGAAIIFRHPGRERSGEIVVLGRKATAIYPEHFLGYSILEGGLREQGRYDEALVQSTKVVEKNPTWGEGHVTRAGLLRRIGRIDEAEAEYDKALELNPEVGRYHLLYGWFLEKHRNRADKALDCYKRAAELDSRYVWGPYHVGRLSMVRINDQSAISWFQDALRIDPDCFPARADLGRALCRLGSNEEAIVHLQKAAETQPANCDVRWWLGEVYLKLRRFADAQKTLEKALACETFPARALASTTTSEIFREKKAREVGIRVASKALLHNPDQGGAVDFLATLLRESESLEPISELNEYLEILERRSKAKTTKPEELEVLALAALRGQKSEYALRYAMEAVDSTNREDAEILATLAEIQVARGETAAAVEALKEAVCLPSARRQHRRVLDTLLQTDPELGAVPSPDYPGVNRLLATKTSIPETRTILINCGGDECTNAAGRLWREDQFFRGGRDQRQRRRGCRHFRRCIPARPPLSRRSGARCALPRLWAGALAG